MTNADKIRSMTDEELAKWLEKQSDEYNQDWDGGLGCYHCIYYGNQRYSSECEDCEWKNGILGWLKKEI